MLLCLETVWTLWCLSWFPWCSVSVFFFLERLIGLLVVNFHAPDIPILPQLWLLNACQFTLQAYFLFNVIITHLVPPHDSLNQPQLPANDSWLTLSVSVPNKIKCSENVYKRTITFIHYYVHRCARFHRVCSNGLIFSIIIDSWPNDTAEK